jgi:uncharacterized membrane-anchored protein YitT (DUF2179 family)
MASKRRKAAPPSPTAVLIKDYAYILVGSFIVAIAFNAFVFPNKIAAGGVSGISTILGHVANIEPGYVQWALNIPLFLLGLWLLGGKFALKTLVGTLVLPFAVVMTSTIEPLTTDALLAALFGGIGIGLGLGLVFRGKGSTGGTALAAQIIHKYTGLTLGVSLLLIDGLIVLSSAFAFNIELALYAVVSVYVTSKTIDLVQIGLGYARVAYIISNEQQRIQQALLKDLDRGVTKLSGKGGYTEEERDVLMCVVNQTEVTKLKDMVSRIDPHAFVVVTSANEVLGEGFKTER